MGNFFRNIYNRSNGYNYSSLPTSNYARALHGRKHCSSRLPSSGSSNPHRVTVIRHNPVIVCLTSPSMAMSSFPTMHTRAAQPRPHVPRLQHHSRLPGLFLTPVSLNWPRTLLFVCPHPCLHSWLLDLTIVVRHDRACHPALP